MEGIVAQYNNRTPELLEDVEQFTLPLSAESLIQIRVLEEFLFNNFLH